MQRLEVSAALRPI